MEAFLLDKIRNEIGSNLDSAAMMFIGNAIASHRSKVMRR